VRVILASAAALALAACWGAAGVDRPFHSVTPFAGGLEQEITIRPAGGAFADERVFRLSSRIINRGSRPMTVRVVTCYLDPQRHLRTRGTLVQRVNPGCIRTPDVYTLAPGEATPGVGFTGQFNRPGRYTVRVRHALDPEFWGEIRVRAR
jgi:hypothetical protein